MEKVILGVILVVAVSVLVRIVWRSVARANDPSRPPSCGSCPFGSKCEMQDRPHIDECGSTCDD
ncbi:MAG: hypothetical protein ABIK85_02995 [Candidatus Eisenbacteria bacterium]